MDTQDQTGAMNVGDSTEGASDLEGGIPEVAPKAPSLRDTKPEEAWAGSPLLAPEKIQNEELEAPENKRGRKSIRTYYDDLANAVKRGGVSMTKMVLAERKREEEKEKESFKEVVKKDKVIKVAPIRPTQEINDEVSGGSHWVIALVSILLVIAGSGLLYYLYIYGLGEDKEPQTPAVSNEFMLVNRETTLDITNLSRNEIISEIKEKGRDQKIITGDVTSVQTITSFLDSETGEVVETPTEARAFLEAVETNIDLALMRSIEPRFMLGIYTDDKDRPFLILRTSFFENAFSGLLRWENNIENDLPFIVVDKKTETASGLQDGGVGSETAPLSKFTDVVIANRDARALTDEVNGIMRVVYSFPDKKTLVITSNAETLKEVFERLATSRFE